MIDPKKPSSDSQGRTSRVWGVGFRGTQAFPNPSHLHCQLQDTDSEYQVGILILRNQARKSPKLSPSPFNLTVPECSIAIACKMP